jgi:hypothetical protein
MRNPHPAGAASPMTCAKLYNLPIARLLADIRLGRCEAPRQVGRRSILTFAAVERYLDSFDAVPHRTINGGPHAARSAE